MLCFCTGSVQLAALEVLSQELAEMVSNGVRFTIETMKSRLQDAFLQIAGCRALALLADTRTSLCCALACCVCADRWWW
jgi:hypothetical protein